MYGKEQKLSNTPSSEEPLADHPEVSHDQIKRARGEAGS